MSAPVRKSMDIDILDSTQSNSDDDNDDEHKFEKRSKRYRPTRSRRKSKTQSCTSLYSFSTLNQSTSAKEQNICSEPNVNYYIDGRTGEIVDLNLTLNSMRQGATVVDRGSKAKNSVGKTAAADGVETTPTSEPHGNGFKASFITVLGKLGMWRKCKESTTGNSRRVSDECGLQSEKGPLRRTASKYFRAFSFTGKLFKIVYFYNLF